VTIIKSFAVGNGDTFYIKHASDNFTIIDCDLNDQNADAIVKELKAQSADKGVTRFISTHPDGDHFGGIELLDAEMPIRNFYVVRNDVIKDDDTPSFQRYCKLRDDSEKAFYIYKGCRRRWMNQGDEGRGSAGISILWPDTTNQHFKDALTDGEAGIAYNNMSAVIRYSMVGGASFLWLGDLDTEFMENITDSIDLEKTTVVFAAHHGRKSGKIPNAWLEKLDPQIIVIGEAASRHLHYYTGYKTITQNHAGDITFDLQGNKVHIYASNPKYSRDDLDDERQNSFAGYIGSITVEAEYTLQAAQ
jgi:beta-lactamase superfamily II metal-dependent hydrolase